MAARGTTVENYITVEEKDLLRRMAREHLFFFEMLSPQALEEFRTLMERHLAMAKEKNVFDATWDILRPVWKITGRDRCHCLLSCVIRRRKWAAQGCKCYICELSHRMQAPIMKPCD